MNDIAEKLIKIGEPFAAGLFEQPDGSIMQRICRAYKRYFETCPMSYVENAPLFPSGPILHGDMAVIPFYCQMYTVDMKRLEEKCREADCPEVAEQVREFDKEHCIWGWSHSVLNYRRILGEGVNRYEKRVRDIKNEELRNALLEVLEGIRIFHERGLAYLRSINADDKLIAALEKVPFEPAQSAYEALVSSNFMLYLDGTDNIGRGDSWLLPYWKGEDLKSVMHCMMKNGQDNNLWSITMGPDYNGLTKQWLNASEGLARPMVELRTTEDMPDDLWQLAMEKVLTGDGQPSFYNEKMIQRRLSERLPYAPKEDIMEFGGVGCTETCFGGMTYSGGIDINLNVLLVLEEHMKENLGICSSFQEFYDTFKVRLRTAQDKIVNELNKMYQYRAEKMFEPIRTLFVDDCIENEMGYYQGGARYTFAIPSESGMPNTIDSLLAIQDLVYERKLYSPEEFLYALETQEPVFKARLAACPCYGVGNPTADALARDLTSGFYHYYREAKMDMGLGIFPTDHQFTRHTEEGSFVGATPDGREAGHALADSIAAVNGKATKGPTLMLRSAANYVQDEIYGIPVLNLSITRKYNPTILRSLIEGYFYMGGTQIQITCTTREALLEARENPDAHRDLIVRVGGFSEYFRKLTDDLKDAVIERTLFEN